MKKRYIVLIIVSVFLILIALSLMYNFFYFRNFPNNIREINDLEKQNVIDLLNKSIDLNGYEIKFGGVYKTDDKEIVQIELIKNFSKEQYFIDLKKGVLIKK